MEEKCHQLFVSHDFDKVQFDGGLKQCDVLVRTLRGTERYVLTFSFVRGVGTPNDFGKKYIYL